MVSDSDFEIVEMLHATPSEELKGHFRTESRGQGVLGLIGWALGARSRVRQVDVRCRGEVIAQTTPSLKRPDIAKAFDDRPDAGTSGFEILIESQGEGESRLTIEAQLEDGTTTTLGELRVKAPRRRWKERFRLS